MKKKNMTKRDKWLDWFEKNKQMILGVLIGLGVGLLVMYLTEDPEIATLKDGTQAVVSFDDHTITANDLYSEMKDYYSVNILVNTMDTMILEKKYKDQLDDINTEVKERIAQERSYYGDSFLTSLQQYGFSSEAQYASVIRLDLLRSKEVTSYAKSLVSDDEINKFYADKVYGDMDTKHILVKPDTANSFTEDDAKNLSQEIIDKLKSGKTFDEVKEEYKDKITYEELGYNAFDASFDQGYLDEMTRLAKLENGSYSTSPVKTTYGYHIVYRIDMKEKDKLDDVKDRIITVIADDKKAADTLIQAKALIKMRENAKLDFTDSVMKEKYEEYKKSALTVSE